MSYTVCCYQGMALIIGLIGILGFEKIKSQKVYFLGQNNENSNQKNTQPNPIRFKRTE